MSVNQELGYFDPEAPAPAKLALRGGADDDDDGTNDNPKTSVDDDDDLDEGGNDEEAPAPNVLKGKDKDEEKEAKDAKRRRRKAAAVVIGAIAALVVLVVLLVLLVPTSETSSGRVIIDNESLAPTTSPTEAEEGTSVPSTSPVEGPVTQSPTFSTDRFLSALSCEELVVSPELRAYPEGIAFKENYTTNDGRELCSDTYVGFPGRPDRNPWTARLGQTDCWVYNYTAGTKVCEDVGARRCTADELQFKVGQGTGCQGDNTLIYSSTVCDHISGVEGIYQVNIELKDEHADAWHDCVIDLSQTTAVRCCADHESEYN